MAITLELTPEQEEHLREAALLRGLTVEGYLLTLVEAIVQPQVRKPLYRRALGRLFRTSTDLRTGEIGNPDQVVRESIRQMRESVLKVKEQAVDAMTTVNMLRSALDQQERQAAEKELKALRALAEQDRERAKRLWQEKTVLEKHMEAVRQELLAALETARERTRAFRKEEERVQERATKAQAQALKAYEAVALPADRIASLIEAMQADAQWDQAFEEWVLLATDPDAESTLAGDLPKPIPTEDVEAFAQQAVRLALKIRSEPSIDGLPSESEAVESFTHHATRFAQEIKSEPSIKDSIQTEETEERSD